MINSILAEFEKDLSVNEQGIGSMSRRALAKLCGVNQKSISYLLNNKILKYEENTLPKSLESLAGVDFSGVQNISDTVCVAILEYYAFDAGRHCTEDARNWYRAIASIGLRKLIQDACGYQESRGLSPEEIVELCCLPVPTEWQRRFPVEYYHHLERLTGLKADGHKRPQLWAKLTKELVYDYLPVGIYQKIKQCKEETGSWDKLHQFLSSEGLMILEKHQQSLLAYMEAVSSLDDLHRLIQQATTKRYQLLLF
jgi:hypothetical protein